MELSVQGNGVQEETRRAAVYRSPALSSPFTASTFVSSRPAIKNLHGCAGMTCQLPGIHLWMQGRREKQAKTEGTQANLRFTDPLHYLPQVPRALVHKWAPEQSSANDIFTLELQNPHDNGEVRG